MDFLIKLAEEDKDTFEIIVGWIGNALALFFFFSPAVLMWDLIKEKIEYKIIPYLSLIANIMNCLLWFIFGWKKDDNQIWLCNGIGGVTSGIYLIIFWFYFMEKKIAKYAGITILTFAILGGIWAFFQFVIEDYEITGYVAMGFNIIMYGAPGQNLYSVYKTGDYNMVPIVSSTMGLLCSTSWGIYGFYGGTTQIIVPNVLGIIFSLIQIAFWIYYYRKAQTTPQLEALIRGNEDSDIVKAI